MLGAPLTILIWSFRQISPRERTDSELLYLSHISKQTFASDAARLAEHPQWERLSTST